MGVRPGDADNDGSVNILDIFPIGEHYQVSGRAREEPLTEAELSTAAPPEWTEYFAVAWKTEGATYADTNGNGKVDAQDIIPIALYWNRKLDGRSPPIDPNGLAIDHPDQLPIYEEMYEVLAHISIQSPGVLALKDGLGAMIASAKRTFIPGATALLQSYPNPSNPETWIPYQLSKASEVEIQIYTVKGELVRTLAVGYKAAGYYIDRAQAAYWEGTNEFGERVGSGIYFYHLRAGQFVAVKRLIILK